MYIFGTFQCIASFLRLLHGSHNIHALRKLHSRLPCFVFCIVLLANRNPNENKLSWVALIMFTNLECPCGVNKPPRPSIQHKMHMEKSWNLLIDTNLEKAKLVTARNGQGLTLIPPILSKWHGSPDRLHKLPVCTAGWPVAMQGIVMPRKYLSVETGESGMILYEFYNQPQFKKNRVDELTLCPIHTK